jgi:hypothetical protein
LDIWASDCDRDAHSQSEDVLPTRAVSALDLDRHSLVTQAIDKPKLGGRIDALESNRNAAIIETDSLGGGE